MCINLLIFDVESKAVSSGIPHHLSHTNLIHISQSPVEVSQPWLGAKPDPILVLVNKVLLECSFILSMAV